MFFNSRNTRLCLHHSLEKWLIQLWDGLFVNQIAKKLSKTTRVASKDLGTNLERLQLAKATQFEY